MNCQIILTLHGFSVYCKIMSAACFGNIVKSNGRDRQEEFFTKQVAEVDVCHSKFTYFLGF
jgi:hypothetical protein